MAKKLKKKELLTPLPEECTWVEVKSVLSHGLTPNFEDVKTFVEFSWYKTTLFVKGLFRICRK